MFLFISDDLERKAWRPVEHHGYIVLCPTDSDERACANAPSRLLVLEDPLATQQSIIETLAHTEPAEVGFLAWLQRRSIVAAALSRTDTDEPAEQFSVDMAPWLERLTTRHPTRGIYFLQIPEKLEVQRGSLRTSPADSIRGAGYRYISLLEACDLRAEHYFDVDPHLRAEGYDVLRTCVRRVLELH